MSCFALRVALLPIIGALAACEAPVGGWQVLFEAEQALAFDSATFERVGEAETSFTLPAVFADNVPGAFYRFSVSFERGGTAGTRAERVFLRVSPRFESFDGTNEVTTFLIEEAGIPQAALIAQGTLPRCGSLGESDACVRKLGLTLGWLAPPEAGASLDVEFGLLVELRGSGTDEPPAAAAASAVLQF